MSTTTEYTLPETGFVRQKQLIPTIVPFSRTKLWRMVKEGTFPAPVKLSPGVTAWRVETIRAWVDAHGLVETTSAPLDGERTPASDRSGKVAQAAKQRANAASVLPARPAPNKTLERGLVAEAKAWSDATATRAYVSHLLGVALEGGGRPNDSLLDWLAWATDVANRLDPAPGRLMKLAKSEAGSD